MSDYNNERLIELEREKTELLHALKLMCAAWVLPKECGDAEASSFNQLDGAYMMASGLIQKMEGK